MKTTILFTVFLFEIIQANEINNEKNPLVLISVLVRNKAHHLPLFLSSLQNLNYPKSRLDVLFQTDNNEDNSEIILEKWKQSKSEEFRSITILTGNTIHDIGNVGEWTDSRYENIIKLREYALHVARERDDLLFSLDADVFFVDSNVLTKLIEKNLPIVAPLLKSDGLYSNFWCGMTEKHYYKRTEEYKPILFRTSQLGCHKVPVLHSAVLIDLRKVSLNSITYNPDNLLDYNSPKDDVITFAVSTARSNIDLHICNDEIFGYIPIPIAEDQSLENEKQNLLNLKLKAIDEGNQLIVSNNLVEYSHVPQKQKFGFDEIYMINLKRRKDRLNKRLLALNEIGMEVRVFEAFDGKNITPDWLQKNGITLLPGYEDPYHKRPIKMGEVGCFLSHYYIWIDMIKKNYEKILILEDDVSFAKNFYQRFMRLVEDMKHVDWELIYMGRKILYVSGESYVSNHLVKPEYSYWTLGYILNLKGAKKLVDAKPLNKLIPVDEYLPIMYDKHPNKSLSQHFPKMHLKTLSVAPLLINPTHYTGEQGYVSDTEDSEVAVK